MATIRELASEAGVSVSTASIVLRGEAKARKISETTQEKVWAAAKRVGYRPNVAARRLRSRTDDALAISIFWASDFRAPMMVRFLRGLQSRILELGRKIDIMIHPYAVGALPDSLEALSVCNAAIVCNASSDDVAFLENMTLPIPVVLYNRRSSRLSAVCVDNEAMGTLPARIFASRGHARAVLLTGESSFPGMDSRESAFVSEAILRGMSVQRIVREHSMAGGFAGGEAIRDMAQRPDSVFCISDVLAIGLLRAFLKAGIRVPEDVEVISIGNGDRDAEEYASTSLSVVHLPMERMAAACLDSALAELDGDADAPRAVTIPFVYRERESCGGLVEA
ncbi:LacI family transcriptional regulator [Eubacteriales bacterium OttesenSCG-928-A19]|nr:LacI family transcriptional regulator [Eubacteriales bacterium OttesenSCG-928-A19]